MKASVCERIKRNSTINAQTGCWEWNRHCDRQGYGHCGVDGVIQQAHRASYVAFKGEIPEGLTIDHLCRNRRCVNPDHLEAVTMRENLMRGHSFSAQNARKTHCVAGHPLSGENLYPQPGRVARLCRACNREAVRKYQKRIKSKSEAVTA